MLVHISLHCRYEIIRKVGTGSFGVAVLVKHQKSGVRSLKSEPPAELGAREFRMHLSYCADTF